MSLVQVLKHSLRSKPSQLLGCIRQNRLAQELPGWRLLRGDALLSLLGHRMRVQTAVDDFDAYIRLSDPDYGDVVVTFRGGKWQPWWNDDLRLLAALVKVYATETVRGVVVIQELDNELTEVYVPAPTKDEAEKLVAEAVQGWRDHSRISKNSPRAFAWCHRCPVKKQCDAMDLERGETKDWPT